jgi:thiamine-phosphate pyrophosphorylase
MRRRQTRIPGRWLIADERSESDLWDALQALPRGSGVLVLLTERNQAERRKLLRQLRRAGRARDLVVADESAGDAIRVHNLKELRRALLRRTPRILLSPIFATRSHVGSKPLPRMRAAAYARLAGRNLIALGGMNERRFAGIERLGFQAWAGIDAFRT